MHQLEGKGVTCENKFGVRSSTETLINLSKYDDELWKQFMIVRSSPTSLKISEIHANITLVHSLATEKRCSSSTNFGMQGNGDEDFKKAG